MLIQYITMDDLRPDHAMYFRNFYECSHDETRWHDDWTCMCNDRCPTCDTETEPSYSEEIWAAG
jgi:hypothetical protein